MPYYIVKNKETAKEELVFSDNKTQAFRLIGEELLDVRTAKPEEIEGKTARRAHTQQQSLPGVE